MHIKMKHMHTKEVIDICVTASIKTALGKRWNTEKSEPS